MILRLRQLFMILAMALICTTAAARKLLVLPEDPAVLIGFAPNGMKYYIISNSSEKGVADFALVQRTEVRNIADSTILQSRKALASSGQFYGFSVPEYLSRRNVAPSKDGYIRHSENATVFKFSNIRLNSEAVDSTLLILMDIAGRPAASFPAKSYSPFDQAIIVSGDINPSEVAAKIRTFSYMIPASEAVVCEDYKPERVASSVDLIEAGSGQIMISSTWVSERLPRLYMNTAQAEVFEMSLHTLGEIAVSRIRTALKIMNIPVASVGLEYVSSLRTPYDDSMSINIIVEEEDASKAEEVMARVITELDSQGAEIDEYLLSEKIYFDDLKAKADNPLKTNAEYIERCENNFLYNSSLASAKERLDFHQSRNLPDTMRLRLFNGITKALLDSSVFNTFSPLAQQLSARVNVSDTLRFPGENERVRLRSVKKEPVSGGELWTFANGFKVIYKRMNTDRMYYNFALNGGYGSIHGLEAGEASFVADYFNSCSISGLNAEEFRNLLSMEDINFDLSVNMSNTIFSGDFPENRIHLFLKSLLAIMNQRGFDRESFGYMVKNNYLALKAAEGSSLDRLSKIDKIMCPNYNYSPYKQVDAVSDDFCERAETFWRSHESKTNDGVLVLVGNMNEEILRRILASYIGGFKTDDSAFDLPVVRYNPVSGWSTYTVDGYEDNIDIVLSTRMPLTADNYFAANLAAQVFKQQLIQALDHTGMHLDLEINCRIYPEERLNMLISISPSSESGFPEGETTKSSIESLAYVRKVLSSLDKIEIDDEVLKFYKEDLKNEINLKMKTANYWLHAIILRYLDGKDLSTAYAAKIDSISLQKIISILKSLNEGSKVEYVTTAY